MFSIFASMDDKSQKLYVNLKKEMVHSRLSQKSEFNNFSQWLEPGAKDNVPTCWDSETASAGQSPMMCK